MSPGDGARGLQPSVRIGAVGYLNARPLVYGLDHHPGFQVRYDVPSECARLLHAGAIDLGLIPSIEYLRGGPYAIVPDLAIASDGPVASVAIFTTRPMADVRSIALDTSSRTSVALVRILCSRLFKINPVLESRGPDLDDMLSRCDAALIIGDKALFLEPQVASGSTPRRLEKIDLGEAWRQMTGLPFVYAFWAGPSQALSSDDVKTLVRARDEGVKRPAELAAEYLSDAPRWQTLGADYLRDNIKYYFGEREQAGLELFYRFAAEAGVVERAQPLRFFND
jgi:chorismate dehydratase